MYKKIYYEMCISPHMPSYSTNLVSFPDPLLSSRYYARACKMGEEGLVQLVQNN